MDILNANGDTNGFAQAAQAALKIGPTDGAVELGGIAYEIAEVEMADTPNAPAHINKLDR